MKKLTSLLLSAFILTIASATAQTKEKINPIVKVVVSDGIILQIERSSEYTLSITTQDVESDCLIKTIEGGTLTLKLRSGFGCKGKVVATLTCPVLEEIEATAKAEISTNFLMKGDSLTAVMRSGGKAYIDLDIKYLNVKVSEWGLFQAEGYAIKQDIALSTSGTFSGYKLEGDDVNIEAYTGSKAKICVAENLTAKAMTNAYISYKCDPKKKSIDAHGTAKIEASTEEE